VARCCCRFPDYSWWQFAKAMLERRLAFLPKSTAAAMISSSEGSIKSCSSASNNRESDTSGRAAATFARSRDAGLISASRRFASSRARSSPQSVSGEAWPLLVSVW